LLLNKGFSHTKVTISLLIAAVGFAGISFYIQSLNINLISAILVLTFFATIFVVKYFTFPRRKHLHVVGENEVSAADLQDTKILTLYASKKENAVLKEE